MNAHGHLSVMLMGAFFVRRYKNGRFAGMGRQNVIKEHDK